jgi:hypothetical protein
MKDRSIGFRAEELEASVFNVIISSKRNRMAALYMLLSGHNNELLMHVV